MIGRKRHVPITTQKVIDAIFYGIERGRPAVFHAGCNDCLLAITGENKMLSGIEYCVGCQYRVGNWDLPDKGLRKTETR